LTHSSSEIEFWLDADAWYTIGTGDAPDYDQWNHLVGTYNGLRKKVYKDGVLIHDIEATGNVDYDTSGIWIGDSGASGNLTGLIDEVRIYNSAVSITQIQSQYLAGLNNLLSNGAISKSEYSQRIKKLSKEIVIE